MVTVVPDLIQPLVAYRMWGYSVDRQGLHLGAVNGGPWDRTERGWAVASCEWMRLGDAYTAPKLPHRAPNEYCTCGFYAMKTIPGARFLIEIASVARGNAAGWLDSDQTGDARAFGCVFGRVELAGKVIEHRLGYRAERGRVLELIPLRLDDQVTTAVAIHLQVPTADPLDHMLDGHALDEFEAPVRPVGGRDRPPTIVERLRLLSHRRHLRLLIGGAAAGRKGTPPPRARCPLVTAGEA
jgi:hypothetical protein